MNLEQIEKNVKIAYNRLKEVFSIFMESRPPYIVNKLRHNKEDDNMIENFA